MEKDMGLHRLVFDYYETRICFGFCRCGESLPSIPQICSAFHLGRRTVRAALAMLEKEGYIKTEERKPAVVVFQAESAQIAENLAKYYVPRKEGIFDFVKAGEILFVPLWEAAMRQMDRSDWKKMQRDLQTADIDVTPLSLKFYEGVLKAWNNRLLINLLSEGIRYLRYPYLIENKPPVITSPELREMSQEDAISFMKDKIETSNRRLLQDLYDYIDKAAKEYDLETVCPIAFHWDIYRQRPQMRYTLASLIIREIMTGEFSVGSYLPSLPQMEKKYGVSLTTIRRTLLLLEELGITRSHQGKGTQVCMEPVKMDFSKPEIREGMRMHQESLQILSLTICQVSRFTLESAGQDKWEELRAELKQIQTEKHCYFCFELFFRFIWKNCPLAAIRECYGRLAGLVSWGYPFTLLYFKEEGLNQAYKEPVSRMEQYLGQKDPAAFSEEWKALMEAEEKRCLDFAGQASGRVD